MNSILLEQKPWLAKLCLFFAGCLVTLSLAPFKLWPLGIAALIILLLFIDNAPKKMAFKRAWWFGFGQFLSGVSWVYISIHDQSNTPMVLATPMTLMWCMFLALFTALFGYAYSATTQSTNKAVALVTVAPAVWVLSDWLRGWILTGFPWLYLGHAYTETFLSGSIPLGGVLLATFIAVLTAGAFTYLLKYLKASPRTNAFIITGVLALLISNGWLSKNAQYVQQNDKTPIALSMIQANILQETKWAPHLRDTHIAEYEQLLLNNYKAEHLYIYPETALPDYYQNLVGYLDALGNKLSQDNNGLITGLVFRDTATQKIYNSMLGFGTIDGLYHKQHLVPFGEYLPFEWLRGLIAFFDLPMSTFSSAPNAGAYFEWKGFNIAPYVCYEIAYPNMVRQSAQQADVLLTASNDTWFGRSFAPAQHMQLAQARALENGRYLIRSTNNGITAVVNEKGRIISQLPQFTTGVLTANIPSFTGNPPYTRFGDWPLLILCGIFLLLALLIRKKT